MSSFHMLHIPLYANVQHQKHFIHILGVQNKENFSDSTAKMQEFLEINIQNRELGFEEKNGLLPT